MRPTRIQLILSIFVTLWCLLILAPPFLAQMGYSDAAAGCYRIFNPICHQMDSHSLHLFGWKLGVCTRCSAIYFSFAAVLLAAPLPGRRFQTISVGRERGLLFMAIAPILVDVLLANSGLHASTPFLRLLTGACCGFLGAIVLVPQLQQGLNELILTIRQRKIPYAPKTR